MDTIVHLQNYQDKSVGVKLQGNRFRDALNIVKDMPVRNYSKSEYIWTIPFGDVAILVTKLRNENFEIEVDDYVKQRYFQSAEWKKGQLNIKKNLFNKEIIDDIKKNMVIDNRMYPFQVIGAYFIYSAGDALLCDMVGLGKTVQSIAAVETHIAVQSINFCMVICPSTLKRNWEDEIKFWAGKDALIIKGNKAKRKQQYKKAYKYDYLIVNYDLLNHDIDLIDELIIQKGYIFALILDEIQYIKNHQAKRSKHAKNISAFAKYSIGLSATAIENSLMDLWSIFQAINETVFGGDGLYFHFKNKYLVLDWFGTAIGYKNEKIVRKRMSPYLVRRLKEQVLDELPDKIESNFWVELSPIQRKFYDEVSKQIVTDISDQEKAEKIKYAEILPMITYLRQCAQSAKLIGHDENISTKTVQLVEFMESLDKDSKVVIFSHFVDMVDILKNELDKKGIKCIGIHANSKSPLYCPIDKRVEVIKNFNSDDSIKALITSDILTEGVNITSANYIINFDILFNPAKMEQRIGRIDRIGNIHKVINVVNFIAAGTIEEEVFKTVWQKRNMSIDILDNGVIEKRLTIRDIKNLLDV